MMHNRKSMEGYRPPYIAGIQKGENLLPNGPFLEVKAAQEVREVITPIPRKWARVNPMPLSIKTSTTHESVQSIQMRYAIFPKAVRTWSRHSS